MMHNSPNRHSRRGTRARRAFVALASVLGAAVPLLVGVLLNADPDANADEPRKVVRLPSALAVDAAAWEASAARPRAVSDLPEEAGAPEFRITKTPPDPKPMVATGQWIFDLRYDHGDVFLVDTRSQQLAAPQETPRVMGRFALELFEGPTLIERVRFDFPFLGATQERGASFGALDRRVVTRIGVIFPMTPRGTRMELRDRATEERWTLPWPPPPPAGSVQPTNAQMNSGAKPVKPR